MRRKNIFGKKGQILVAVPFLVVFLIGAIILSINLGILLSEYVRMQTAADAASRTGAYFQAQARMAISKVNESLMIDEAMLIGYAVCIIASGGTSVRCWIKAGLKRKDIYFEMQHIQSIKNKIPSIMDPFVRQTAFINGADGCTIDASKLYLDWSMSFLLDRFGWPGEVVAWILENLFGIPGIMGPTDNIIKDYVEVTLAKQGRPVFGEAILGKGLRFPNFKVVSRANPCWLGFGFSGWHDPGSDDTGWFECMIQPFPVWTSKITHKR